MQGQPEVTEWLPTSRYTNGVQAGNRGGQTVLRKLAMDSRIQVTEGQEPETRSRGQEQGKMPEIIRAPFKTKI